MRGTTFKEPRALESSMRSALLVLLAMTSLILLAGCPGDGGDSGYARTDEAGDFTTPGQASAGDLSATDAGDLAPAVDGWIEAGVGTR